MSMKVSGFHGLPSPNTKASYKSNQPKDKSASRDSLSKLIFSQANVGATVPLNCQIFISDSKSGHFLTGTILVPYISED